MIGWQSTRFTRLKSPKALAEYLKPPLTAEQKRDADAARVAALLDRMAGKDD